MYHDTDTMIWYIVIFGDTNLLVGHFSWDTYDSILKEIYCNITNI